MTLSVSGAGWDGLKRVYRSLRERYHGEDKGGWALSCGLAFEGYGCKQELEDSGWELEALGTHMFAEHGVDEMRD